MNAAEVATIAVAILTLMNFSWTVLWSIKVARQVREIRNDEEIKKIDNRLARLEEFKDAMPKHVASREDVERLHSRISDVRKELHSNTQDIKAISEGVKGIGKNVDLLTKAQLQRI